MLRCKISSVYRLQVEIGKKWVFDLFILFYLILFFCLSPPELAAKI
jgi:hypothetical protein